MSDEVELKDEFVELNPIYDYEGSLTNEFVDSLNGDKKFKDFVSNYMNENIWVMEENDSLEEYDYHFTNHLLKAFIAYSKLVLEDVKRNSKKKELKVFVEHLQGNNNIIWHDIYLVITRDNKGKRFARFIKDKK